MAPTILHVEDNADNRQIVRDLFSARGYRIIEAEDGVSGVELASRMANELDIILMDIQLPKMSGYDAVRAIKSNRKLRDIPIIVVTSYALSGDDRKAFEAGADDYIAKPYKPSELRIKVETWIAGRKGNTKE
ncbi:MAG: response regulator [Deltaproteobacteria bacterium]|nr:response regulator [Deltaproteobacteria bacterium]MBW2306625.1 response regulator [Deltaproteobacteria bacterium]